MKRHGNLWPRVISPENLELAYKKSRKGKSRMYNVQRFEANQEANLERIRLALADKTFTTSPYQEKRIFEPKERTIYVLPFAPDRIVQHALMNVLEPVWEGLFIHHSYACRPGKGQHAGSRVVSQLVRKHHYCLKCDISKFYPSVDHQILLEIIERKIKCPDTMWLIRDIVNSMPGGKNVPIGNYTSQWFGNLYLNELDQELKHRHQVRAYVRYCDDFVLFHDDKAFLRDKAAVIEEFLERRLKLRMSICDLFPTSQGVDFLGYRHFGRYLLLRKSTAQRMRRRLRALPGKLNKGAITPEQFRSSLASMRGWLKWANTHHLSLALELDALEEVARAA